MTKYVSKVILATINILDDKLANQVEKHKFTVSEDAKNVLKRYIDASNVYGDYT